jgi:hypothetical protein
MVQASLQPDLSGGSTIAQVADLYGRMVPSLDQIIAFQQVLYSTASYFDEQLALLQQQDTTIGDRSFLSFASRLIRGGSGEGPADGMTGVMAGYWQAVVGGAERAVAELANASYLEGLSQAGNREYGRSVPLFENTGVYIRYPLALLDKEQEFRDGGGFSELVLFDQRVFTEDAENFLKYQSMSRALRFFLAGAELGSRYERLPGTDSASVESWRQGRIGSDEVMRQERLFREASGGLLSEIEDLLAGLDAERAELRNYQDAFEDSAGRNMDILQYADRASSMAGDLRAQVFDGEFEAAARFYTVANGEFERRLNSRKAEYDEGNRLIQGIPRNATGGGANVDHYPSEGLAVLTRMEEEIAADIIQGTDLLNQYAGERGEVLNAGAVNTLYVSARAMVDDLRALLAQGQRAAAAARIQIAQAETFRIDGDRFFREARSALAQNNFDAAHDRVQRASERFNSSLAIQESVSLRTEWDTQLVNLGEEIKRRENEVVVRDVREMVNNARNAYFTGNFEQAEDLLVRAQNRWHVTNVGNDTEVAYWLNIVRGALTLRSGRVISPTAPLYAEMSQLLSDARKNYDEGVRYLNANQRTEGIARFTQARQKTQEVKLMFPVNQEARLLELRMDQMTDQRAFDASFEQRFFEAVAGTKRQSPESFTDLQNLAEINPRYPGMAAALIRAEINMGYRLPPPDPRDIARSNELTAAARQIIDRNITVQFEVALQQLNEALILNPNNAQAIAAKDQLQTRMGGTGTLVWDSRSEALYGQVVNEFQRGNYLIASAILEQLLQDPKIRSSTRIQELQRRIEPFL